MAQLAKDAASNPLFQSIVHAYISDGSIGNIDRFTRYYFRYRDEREEVVREPLAMLEDLVNHGYMEGDCDDISTLTAAILRVYGYPAKFVAIRYDSDPEFKHVFVETGNERLDATVPEGTQHVELERMEQYVV